MNNHSDPARPELPTRANAHAAADAPVRFECTLSQIVTNLQVLEAAGFPTEELTQAMCAPR